MVGYTIFIFNMFVLNILVYSSCRNQWKSKLCSRFESSNEEVYWASENHQSSRRTYIWVRKTTGRTRWGGSSRIRKKPVEIQKARISELEARVFQLDSLQTDENHKPNTSLGREMLPEPNESSTNLKANFVIKVYLFIQKTFFVGLNINIYWIM